MTGAVLKVPPETPAAGVFATTRFVAASATPVAVKVSGDPARPDTVAVMVLAPDALPNCQLVTVAIPRELVVTLLGDTAPPPDVTAKATVTPETGLPTASVTVTLGDIVTLSDTVAVWLSPAFTAIVAAAPGPVAMSDPVALVNPVAEYVTVVATESEPV